MIGNIYFFMFFTFELLLCAAWEVHNNLVQRYTKIKNSINKSPKLAKSYFEVPAVFSVYHYNKSLLGI